MVGVLFLKEYFNNNPTNYYDINGNSARVVRVLLRTASRLISKAIKKISKIISNTNKFLDELPYKVNNVVENVKNSFTVETGFCYGYEKKSSFSMLGTEIGKEYGVYHAFGQGSIGGNEYTYVSDKAGAKLDFGLGEVDLAIGARNENDYIGLTFYFHLYGMMKKIQYLI